jgi:Amt family ammonium transporter
VTPVHGVGGILGTLLTGIFAAPALGGLGYAEGVTMGAQVKVQVIGILAVGAWSGVVTWVLLKLTDAMAGMRVTSDQESEGLDTVEHNEKGYNL